MGCAALTAEYTSRNMPAAGTYVSFATPSFDLGVAADSFVYFMVIPEHGTDIGGGGSNQGQIEVLEATDAVVTVRVDYRDTLSDGDYLVSGDFSAVRCP